MTVKAGWAGRRHVDTSCERAREKEGGNKGQRSAESALAREERRAQLLVATSWRERGPAKSRLCRTRTHYYSYEVFSFFSGKKEITNEPLENREQGKYTVLGQIHWSFSAG